MDQGTQVNQQPRKSEGAEKPKENRQPPRQQQASQHNQQQPRTYASQARQHPAVAANRAGSAGGPERGKPWRGGPPPPRG